MTFSTRCTCFRVWKYSPNSRTHLIVTSLIQLTLYKLQPLVFVSQLKTHTHPLPLIIQPMATFWNPKLCDLSYFYPVYMATQTDVVNLPTVNIVNTDWRFIFSANASAFQFLLVLWKCNCDILVRCHSI